MPNQYGQTDILAQVLASQPRSGATPLGTGLRLGAAALAQYGQRRGRENQTSELADALAGINRGSMTAAGPTMDTAGPIQDPAGMAKMLMNPATRDLANAMLSKSMAGPEKPQYKQVGNTLVQIGPDGVSPVYEAPSAPEKPQIVKGADGYMYNADTGQRALPGVQRVEDNLITVPGVGVFDRATNSFVGMGPSQNGGAALPTPEFNPAANLPPKPAADVRADTIKKATSVLQDEAAALESQRTMMGSLDRFEQLMQVQDTGGLLRKLPGAGTVEGAFDPQVQEMHTIADKLTPLMRQGLPGAASDTDVAMFRGATVGPDKLPEVNRNIITGMRASLQNAEDRLAFRQAYLGQNGTLSGADEQWNNYLNANPIFDMNSSPERPQLNRGRQTWRDYFTGAGDITAQIYAAQSVEELNNIDPSKMTAEQLEAAERRYDQIVGGN